MTKVMRVCANKIAEAHWEQMAKTGRTAHSIIFMRELGFEVFDPLSSKAAKTMFDELSWALRIHHGLNIMYMVSPVGDHGLLIVNRGTSQATYVAVKFTESQIRNMMVDVAGARLSCDKMLGTIAAVKHEIPDEVQLEETMRKLVVEKPTLRNRLKKYGPGHFAAAAVAIGSAESLLELIDVLPAGNFIAVWIGAFVVAECFYAWVHPDRK